MTDEQLGRAWCGARGLAPRVGADGFATWSTVLFGGMFERDNNPHMLPKVVYAAAGQSAPFEGTFGSEVAAYAAVGIGLRNILGFADGVRAAIASFDPGSPGGRQDVTEWVAAALEDGLPRIGGLDEDERSESLGELASTVVDTLSSHFRPEAA